MCLRLYCCASPSHPLLYMQSIIGGIDLSASELKLHRFGLGTQHALTLGESLGSNGRLRHVDLGSNPLRDAGVVRSKCRRKIVHFLVRGGRVWRRSVAA